MKDALYREAIQSDLDKTLVVEAAAGTGKTTALVHRILAVISTGLGELSRIALALRARVPILVEDRVFEKAERIAPPRGASPPTL